MQLQNISLTDETFYEKSPSGFSGYFITVGQCFVCLLICCAVFGNLLIYSAFFINSKLKTSTNAFILSLATSDMLLAALVMPLDVARLVHHLNWPLGVAACSIWNSMTVALGSATICNLCAVGVERYLAITRPLKHNSEISSGVIISLTFLWIFAFMNGLGSYFIWEQSNSKVCVGFSAPVRSSVILLVINILIPFIICLSTYGKIYHISRRQARRIMATRSWFSTGGRSFSREKKSAKTLSLLVGAFTICFMPFFIFHVLHSTYKDKLWNSFYMSNVVRWLAYVNPATNWALYGFLNREFRETFMRIFNAFGVRMGICTCLQHTRRNENSAEAYVMP